MSNDDLILEHYRKEAERHQLDSSSTMADERTRQLELESILTCLDGALSGQPAGELLEVGCGNGLLLETLRPRYPELGLTGADYSPEMVELANQRGVERCTVQREDVRHLSFEDARFDVIVLERCIINVLDEAEQGDSLRELHRVLKPGGHVVLIEAFTDGLTHLNTARDELGLDPIQPPYHNRWMDKRWFLDTIDGLFRVTNVEGSDLPPINFLSSHYFVSRVLYAAVTNREIRYNTEFVKFFNFLPPHGEFSPVQLYFLAKL
jgi:SAM-dependent methyltransferase